MQSFWLSLFLWLACVPAFAVDSLSRYLEEGSFHILTIEDGEPICVDALSPSFYFERWAAADTLGNRYVLNLAPPNRVAEHLAVHQFLEALGVAHIPAYPVFVKRGQNGVPVSAVAREIGVQDHPTEPDLAAKYGTIGENGEWVLAFLQPEWVDLNPMEVPEGGGLPPLTLVQLEELAEAYLAVHALRAIGYSVDIVNGHPLVTYVRGPFIQGRLTSQLALEKNFWDREKHTQYYPAAQLWELNDSQVAHFLRHTSAFIGRLEALKKNNVLERIFGDYFQDLEDFWRLQAFSARPEHHTRARLFKYLYDTIDSIRTDFTAYLRNRVARNFKITPDYATTGGATLSQLSVDTPFVAAPSWTPPASITDLKPIEDKASRNNQAKEILLGLALAREDARAAVLGRWKNPSFDPLETLLRDAKSENKLHPVYQHPFPGPSRLESADPPQFFVNIHAPKTLLVVSPNDVEGRLIQQVALRLGPYLNISVYRGVHGQGEELSEDDAHDIRFHAEAGGYKRIILCEFGDTSRGTLNLMRFTGLDSLIHLDHHRERVHRFSTAEQFFHLYNYHPSLSEYLAAVRDRSGPYGFKDFGYTAEQVGHYLEAYGNRDVSNLLQNYRPFFQDNPRNIYEVEYDGSIESLGTPFGLVGYPNVANVLAIGYNRLSFIGIAPAVQRLETQFEKGQGSWRRRQYVGGDPRGPMFWVLRVNGRADKDAALAIARQTISQTPELHDHCWQILATEGGTPFPRPKTRR
ncbi:MAG: hypothetical protein H6617_07890 [Bdellovibrionaceae bacterium]|nr:hypothetical protein [Pseudobdellovibrionaceae bacterium]